MLGMLGTALAMLMLAIAVVDARRFMIPDYLTATAFALACAYAAILQPDAPVASVGFAILRAVVFASALFVVRALYLKWRGLEAIGLGDVKLAAAAGAWLDWTMMPVAIEIAALAALAWCGVAHVSGKRRMTAMTRVPFGLFFAPAIYLSWLLQAALAQ